MISPTMIVDLANRLITAMERIADESAGIRIALETLLDDLDYEDSEFQERDEDDQPL